MGTRSDIIVHCKDGKWRRIYCHWDGYLENNGRILFDHYTGQDKIEQLIALGDLSSLGEKIGKKHAFEFTGKTFGPDRKYTAGYLRWKKSINGMCTAYGRDRGDKDCAATLGDTIQSVWPPEDTWTEFTYVWHDDGDGPRWWVTSPDEGTQTLVDLGQALKGEVTVRADVKAFGMVIGKHQPTAPAKDHTWSRAKVARGAHA